jgi:hypothetical protein
MRYKRLVKDQILKRSAPDFDTNDFAYWVAKYWNAIGAQYFAKFKVYPEPPAMGWFIKFLETYVLAYEQREFLDDLTKRSETDILRRAKKADAAIDYSAKVAETAAARIEQLESELRERDGLLDQYEKGADRIENPDLSPNMRRILKRSKKIDFRKF